MIQNKRWWLFVDYTISMDLNGFFWWVDEVPTFVLLSSSKSSKCQLFSYLAKLSSGVDWIAYTAPCQKILLTTAWKATPSNLCRSVDHILIGIQMLSVHDEKDNDNGNNTGNGTLPSSLYLDDWGIHHPLRKLAEMLWGEELKDCADVQVLLHRSPQQFDGEDSWQLLGLRGVYGGLVEQVHLGHDQHHGDVAALLLHLSFPSSHLQADESVWYWAPTTCLNDSLSTQEKASTQAWAPLDSTFSQKILFSWKYVCAVELGNPERGELWAAPVVSPGYAVKLLLASRVPQHHPHVFSIHAGEVRKVETRKLKKILTIFSFPRNQLQSFSYILQWRSPCNTSGSSKTSQRPHFPQSPPGNYPSNRE